jgi:hypothetical protein
VQAADVQPGASAQGGRGLFAVRDIAAGAVFLRIPEALLLTPTQLAAEASAGLRPEAALALRLLLEAAEGDASRWAQYLRSLPAGYGDAGGWSESECDELQLPSAVRAALALRETRLADWHAAAGVRARLLPPRLRSWAAWSWAASTVATRTVYAGEACGPAGALCPVGDLVNHCVRGDEPAGRGDLSGGFFEFRTARAVAAGGELHVSYGAHDSAALLLLYGFCPAEPFAGDCVPLPARPFLTTGLETLPEEALFVDCDGQPGFALLAGLRLAHAPKDVRRTCGHAAAAGEPLCVESERAAHSRLRLAAAAALAALPSSLSQDEATLTTVSDRPAQQLLWRMRAKRALVAAVSVAEARLAALPPEGGATLVDRRCHA